MAMSKSAMDVLKRKLLGHRYRAHGGDYKAFADPQQLAGLWPAYLDNSGADSDMTRDILATGLAPSPKGAARLEISAPEWVAVRGWHVEKFPGAPPPPPPARLAPEVAVAPPGGAGGPAAAAAEQPGHAGGPPADAAAPPPGNAAGPGPGPHPEPQAPGRSPRAPGPGKRLALPQPPRPPGHAAGLGP